LVPPWTKKPQLHPIPPIRPVAVVVAAHAQEHELLSLSPERVVASFPIQSCERPRHLGSLASDGHVPGAIVPAPAVIVAVLDQTQVFCVAVPAIPFPVARHCACCRHHWHHWVPLSLFILLVCDAETSGISLQSSANLLDCALC